NAAETGGIDWGTEFYTVPLGLENIFGYDTDWQQEYVNFYLYAVSAADVPKLWGILNVKYITSGTLIDTSNERLSNLALVGKFDNCSICFPEEPAIQKAWGPYLYENKRVLPRAFLANYSMLVIAHPDIKLSVIKTLMTRDDFDPGKAVIVFGQEGKVSVSDYRLEDLKNYNKVVLAGGRGDGSGMQMLKSYIDGGGVLMPNLPEGETAFTLAHLEKLFADIGGSYEPISDSGIVEVNFGKKEVILPSGSKGRFLVLSERYSWFTGWTAKAFKKVAGVESREVRELELFRANGAVTAVYIDDDYEKIVFEYRPKSFVVGSVITVVSIFTLLGYFAYLIFVARSGRKPAAA
ncbi:hypothetical protein HYV82_05630, partial [Candidatus Woesearchaeota archaeon]|nr:hypothetical protein [Candidatus Woesearchaeota archaeon]